MRIKLLSLAFVAIAASYSCVHTKNADGSNNDLISNFIADEGKGEITEKSYPVDFDELEVSTSLRAEVYKSNKEEVIVYAPSDLMKYIIVKQTGNKVQVKIETQGFKSISTDRVRIKIYARDFDKLSANSSGSIILKDKFSNPIVDVKVSSSGDIKGNLEGNEINIQASSSGDFDGEIYAKKSALQISSSGEINVKGKVTDLSVQASSSGEIKAENLTAENATLSTSSSADITVGVSNSVTASASSSGDIRVIKRGSLNNITKNESSSGTITIK